MMEDLFNNILVLVPVALLIFLRVFAEGARNRSKKAGAEAGQLPPSQGTPPRTAATPAAAGASKKPAPGQASGGRVQSPSIPPERRDLLGRLKRYLEGSLERMEALAEPLHFEEETARRLASPPKPSANAGKTGPRAGPSHQEGLSPISEEPSDIPQNVPSLPLKERLEGLSYLKRALVLSEILGKPKSLQ